MGIVNATPDSFSDGGRALEPKAAIELGRKMLDDGATLLDIGGESTRPGARPVPPVEEQRRILPIVEALAPLCRHISVDTRNAETMLRALDAGATIINDVSGLRHDAEAAAALAGRDCAIVLMHSRGTPQTMTGLTDYGDVALEVLHESAAIVDRAIAAGIDRSRIAVDPGFGFAKTQAQSREILQRLPLFLNLCCPIIAGMSRKSFIGEMAAVADPAGRDAASLAAAMIALSLGATILRVHDVASTVAGVRVWEALAGSMSLGKGE